MAGGFGFTPKVWTSFSKPFRLFMVGGSFAYCASTVIYQNYTKQQMINRWVTRKEEEYKARGMVFNE